MNAVFVERPAQWPSPDGGESKSLVYNRPERMKVTVSFNHCEVLFPSPSVRQLRSKGIASTEA